MLLPYRVKVSDTKVLHTILVLCTCLYRSHLRKPVSMKQTKHSRKSEAQNLCSKCPPFTRTHAFKRLHHCAIAAVMMVWFSSLHSPSRRSFNSFTSGSANGRPSLEGYPRCCSPPDSNLANWVATSGGINSWRLYAVCSMVTISRAR